MVIIPAMIGLALVTAILCPFWLGGGSVLAPSSGISDSRRLRKTKERVLERYLQDENSFKDRVVSRSEWGRRQQFLINKYIDLSRQLDYLEAKGYPASAAEGEQLS